MFKQVDLEQYQPETVKNTLEFQTLAAVEKGLLQEVWNGAEAVWNNQFVDTLQEEGCGRWETILNIQPKLSDDVTVRRFRIKTRMNEEVPYTYRALEQALDALCGPGTYDIKLEHEKYHLQILLELTVQKLLDEVEAMTERMVPANMLWEILLRYNQWKNYAEIRWKEAGKYTWKQMREEVL